MMYRTFILLVSLLLLPSPSSAQAGAASGEDGSVGPMALSPTGFTQSLY
jgi:hypothetical protein